MKQYEYYTLTNDTYLGEKILNKLGEAGWELITHAYQQTVHHVYTFKREKEKASPQDISAIEDKIKDIEREIKKREQEIANAILRHKVWTRQVG